MPPLPTPDPATTEARVTRWFVRGDAREWREINEPTASAYQGLFRDWPEHWEGWVVAVVSE